MSIFTRTLPNYLGGLAVAATVVLIGWLWTHYSGGPTTTNITYPRENGAVPHKTPIEGQYSTKYRNSDLWIVVQPINFPMYHPQISPVAKQQNGKWDAVAWLGESPTKNIGDKFILHLVSADANASSSFSTYLIQANATRRYPGMATLPVGAAVVVSTSVYRK